MAAYILRRILLIVPTLLGIMIINFAIIQSAPGGPVEQAIARMEGQAVSATARLSGGAGGGGEVSSSQSSSQGSGTGGSGSGGLYRGSQGLPDELVEKIQVKYGFDKPWYERFYIMMGNYLTFDFGDSFFIGRPVVDIVIEKMPVSISLGLWSLLITYMISIPLGVAKAVRDGSRFDIWSSATVIIGNALPAFLFAVLLIVLFAGGRYFDWFPLRGLVSDNWGDMSWPDRIIDYFWHLALPITALVIGSFASLTMLTKNSFMDEINKQYVMTARAKGLSEKQVLFGHVFRNAMLIVIAGFPAALVSILFTGALLVEVIFSLDGLGLLGFEAAINRDYPIVFGTLYFLTLLGLFMALLRDIVYAFVDPRIDFEKRGA